MEQIRWSVTLEATGDRELTREEIVELADAVAHLDGVASGIGQTTYGVQILVDAPTRDQAAERGRTLFAEAVARAGLPPWPLSTLVPMSERDELEQLEEEVTVERRTGP